MDQRLRSFYLETQINNASPGQLLIMLYDGLIQNAERADTEISSPENPNDLSQAAHAISRCIDILTELSTSLDYSVDPSLCGSLRDLYIFFTREFSQAFDKREPKKIRAILPLIRELRNAWFEADRRSNQLQFVAA
jgi:flagellar protein FliS